MWGCVRQIMSQAHNQWLIIIPLNPNFPVTRRPLTTQSHKLCWSCRLQNRKWISVWAPNRISSLQRAPPTKKCPFAATEGVWKQITVEMCQIFAQNETSVILIGLCNKPGRTVNCSSSNCFSHFVEPIQAKLERRKEIVHQRVDGRDEKGGGHILVWTSTRYWTVCLMTTKARNTTQKKQTNRTWRTNTEAVDKTGTSRLYEILRQCAAGWGHLLPVCCCRCSLLRCIGAGKTGRVNKLTRKAGSWAPWRLGWTEGCWTNCSPCWRTLPALSTHYWTSSGAPFGTDWFSYSATRTDTGNLSCPVQ